MKKLKKYLMLVFIIFFWLLWIINADLLDGPEKIYKYSNYRDIDNVNDIAWYNIFNLWCVGYKTMCYFKEIYNYDFTISPLFLINISSENIESIRNSNSSNYFESELDALKQLSNDDIVIVIPKEYEWGYSGITWKNYRQITYHLNQTYSWINLVKKSVQEYGSWNCSSQMLGWHSICVDDWWLNLQPIIYWITANEYLKEYIYDANKNYKKVIWDKKFKGFFWGWSISAHKPLFLYIKYNHQYINNFLRSLIITILLETFALFFLCKLFFKKDNLKTWKIILTWILASSITLPILRFVLPHIFHNYTVYAIVGEVFVTFVEIFIIKYILDINRQKSTIASIACNLFSVIIGLLL